MSQEDREACHSVQVEIVEKLIPVCTSLRGAYDQNKAGSEQQRRPETRPVYGLVVAADLGSARILRAFPCEHMGQPALEYLCGEVAAPLLAQWASGDDPS
jgi:hypothetical protein